MMNGITDDGWVELGTFSSNMIFKKWKFWKVWKFVSENRIHLNFVSNVVEHNEKRETIFYSSKNALSIIFGIILKFSENHEKIIICAKIKVYPRKNWFFRTTDIFIFSNRTMTFRRKITFSRRFRINFDIGTTFIFRNNLKILLLKTSSPAALIKSDYQAYWVGRRPG